MPTKVKDLQELKEKASNGYIGCFIVLNYGLRSSKDISYNPTNDTWSIYNYIDDTEQIFNETELARNTNIIEALNKNSLYYD